MKNTDDRAIWVRGSPRLTLFVDRIVEQVAVHFLTPCHATPLHSYLHIRQSTGRFELFGSALGDDGDGIGRAFPTCVDLQYLECAPNFDLEPVSRSKTDSAQFLAEPQDFVMRRYQGSADPDVHGCVGLRIEHVCFLFCVCECAGTRFRKRWLFEVTPRVLLAAALLYGWIDFHRTSERTHCPSTLCCSVRSTVRWLPFWPSTSIVKLLECFTATWQAIKNRRTTARPSCSSTLSPRHRQVGEKRYEAARRETMVMKRQSRTGVQSRCRCAFKKVWKLAKNHIKVCRWGRVRE